MNKQQSKFRIDGIYFLFLLPVFFVQHGVAEHFPHVPAMDALVLTLVYIGFALLFCVIGWLFFRNWKKAAIFSLCLMAFHFFFGAIHDGIKYVAPDSFLSRYSFVLPFFVLLLIGIVILLKRSYSGFSKLTSYLNLLLIILIAIDLGTLAVKSSKNNIVETLPAGMSKCDSCKKPDIYLLMFDEYAGQKELQAMFGFANTDFIDALKQRGFYNIDSSNSNYNYTPFSVASILNMDYLLLSDTNRSGKDVTMSYDVIRNNRFLQYLQAHGYAFRNYSIFDFRGQPARIDETFIPVKTRLITAQTFLSRMNREIRFNTVDGKFRLETAVKEFTYRNLHNNNNIFELTTSHSSSPQFVYAHFMMPHYPYYFNAEGREQPYETLSEGNQVNKSSYIEYLLYTNKKIISLVDTLLNRPNKPVIFLMSDHGFRHFSQPKERKYYFMNLSAIYSPDGNYAGYDRVRSSVNLLKVFLGNQFHQRLEFSADSTIYLRD